MEALLALGETEQDSEVLAEVARSLGYRRDPRGAAPLLGWRDHPEQPVRFFVACSLPDCCSSESEEQVVRALIELTDDESGAVRDYALFGLRELELDSPEIRAVMLRHVDDSDTSAAGEALVGLATLHDERGIEPLKTFLRSAPHNHVAGYGLEAAGLHADPRLLSTLEALRDAGGDWPDLDAAIQSCAETPRA